MNRNEAIEIAAKAYAESHGRPNVHHLDRRDAGPIIDALIASGVIPAEGDVVIERGRWERVRAFARSSLNSMRGTPDGLTVILNGSDLDAIPAAPTGEGEA